MDINKGLYLVDMKMRSKLSLSHLPITESFSKDGDVFKFKNSVNLVIELNKEEVSIEATIRHKNNIFIISYPLVPDGSNFLHLDTSFNKEEILSKLKDYFTELEDTFLSSLNTALYNFVNYTLNEVSNYYKSLFGLEVLNTLRVSLVVSGISSDDFSIKNFLEEFYSNDRVTRDEDTSIEDFIIEDYLSDESSIYESIRYSLMYTSFESTFVINLLKEGRYLVGIVSPYELYTLLPTIYDSYVRGTVPLKELISELHSNHPSDIMSKELWSKYENN